MLTDPISDMLTRIRNAMMARKKEVVIPASNLKFAVAKIMEQEKYIGSVDRKDDNHGEIHIKLKYDKGISAIKDIKRVSKPGRRVYVASEELPRVLNGYGMAIISTSRGIMTNKEARKEHLGGEVICEIY
jgi:small subunit ribosomal protein S8